MEYPAVYEIVVPGYLDANWEDLFGGMEIFFGCTEGDLPFTTITGPVDQAKLHGLLRWLYSLGLPLISVNCIDNNKSIANNQED
jgi:hypothetical protein